MWNWVDIRRLEIVLFLHMRHNLVQSFVLGNEEIEYFALIFLPIQGCLAV